MAYNVVNCDQTVRGCLKSPDSRQILSSMCLLQLPESCHEACTTSVNLALAELFKHPLTAQGDLPAVLPWKMRMALSLLECTTSAAANRPNANLSVCRW